MSDGALLELVARGKKDAFFLQNPTKSLFGAPYNQRSPSTREIWYQETESPAQFGKFVDIEIPRVGDILKSVDVLIQLPTWLPPDIADLNRSIVLDASGNPSYSITIKQEFDLSIGKTKYLNYGWTNGVANFLIKRWVLLMDSIQLQEGYGDYNDWHPDSETTHLRASLIHQATGTHDGSNINIQRNATPPELIFHVPLVGCQREGDTGLPIIGVRSQKLVLRLFLADRLSLVESGTYEDAPLGGKLVYEVCPNPWGGREIYVCANNPSGCNPPTPATPAGYTLQPQESGNPIIRGRFEILHVDAELRKQLIEKPHEILYTQQVRQDFTLENKDWPSVPGLVHSKNVAVELQGLFQRIMLGLTSLIRKRQNKYRDLNPPITHELGTYSPIPVSRSSIDWMSLLSFQVNSQDRVYPWPTGTFQELSQNLQLKRDVARQLYFIVFGVSPDSEPGGALNLARTQKANLIMNLNYILPDTQLNSRLTFASMMAETWNVLDIKGGLANVRFAD